MLMVVMVPREKWTDERLDELNKKVDDGFADVRDEMRAGFTRVDGEIKGLRREMDARFDKVDSRFDKVDARFEAINARFEALTQELFRGAVAIIVAVVGAAAAIIAALIAVNL